MTTKLKQTDGIILFLISYAFMLLLSIFTLGLKGDTATYVSFLIPQFAYITVTLIYLLVKKESFKNILCFKKPNSPLSFIFVVPTAFGILFGFLLVGISFQWLLDFGNLGVTLTLPKLNNAKSIILSLIIICVLPAIGEELMFRGVFLSIFKNRSEKSAVILSALVFSLTHFNLSQLVYQFILGLLLAFITIKTKNIIFASIIHFINNATILILPLFIPKFDNLSIFSPNHLLILAILCIAGIAVLIPSMYLTTKFADKTLQKGQFNIFKLLFSKKNLSDIESKEPISVWFFAFIITLSIAAVLTSFV